MAIGRPQVVSDCPPQADVVSKCKIGLVHRAGDDEDLSQRILELYHDEEMRKVMGQRSNQCFEEEWNWEKTSKDLVELYDSLTTSNAS